MKAWTDTKPHSPHTRADGGPRYVNRLATEQSPYLRQHANNPVNWFPWGPEALERAKKENKPIFLSVGYSTCHWCHVMARESFEDEKIAKYLNENFISIKVDREVRPDIDDLYMRAVRVLSGQGGWPMTVVLTPDQEPFFGGTYMPARDGDRGAQRGLLGVLRQLAGEYAKDRKAVVARAKETSSRIKKAVEPAPAGDVPQRAAVSRAAEALVARSDPEWGGFGSAPKFPRPAILDLLLEVSQTTTNEKLAREAQKAATSTLDKMYEGGLFDHVGGGFHRYATDRKWRVPHFEKMLYDGAQLAATYLEAYRITKSERYADVARATVEAMLRDMKSPEGGFFAASDAESETPQGKRAEGYFYTWTPEEVRAVLDEGEAEVITAYYGIDDAGDLDGRNVLFIERPAEEVAQALSLDFSNFQQILEEARRKLSKARARRKPPAVDRKILTAENGLAIAVLSDAALLLNEPRYLEAARRAAEQVFSQARDQTGQLFRTATGKQPAFAEDYAFLVYGLSRLFLASSDLRTLRAARSLQGHMDQHFWDEENGGYFRTSKVHDDLFARDKPTYDGEIPSANSIAALNHLFFANVLDSDDSTKRVEGILRAFSSDLASGTTSPLLLLALDRYLETPRQIIIVHPGSSGPAPGSEGAKMQAALARTPVAGAVTFVIQDEMAPVLAKELPILSGKRAAQATTAYVCERGRCSLPARDVATLEKQLDSL